MVGLSDSVFPLIEHIVYCVASDLVVGGDGVLKGHDGLIYHHPWSPQEAGRRPQAAHLA